MNYGKRSTKAAFTLIEILVVVSVMAILSSVGFASYINFNRSQIVNQAAQKIIEDLRLAQSLAANNQKPEEECETLNGYSFIINKNNKSYRIVANCSPKYEGEAVKTGLIPSNLIISYAGYSGEENTISFRVLDRAVSANSLEITVSGFNGNYNRTVLIGSGGTIKLKNE